MRTQDHGIHCVDHLGEPGAEFVVEAVELELEGILD